MQARAAQLDYRNPSGLIVAVLIVLACAVFFLHPYALLLLVCLFAVVSPTKDFKWLFLVSACVLFTMLNIPKQLDDDLTNYIAMQDYISVKPFLTLFNKDELRLISGTYRVTELGFYAPLWILSRVVPDSSADLAIFATIGIYIPTFLGFTLIGKSENWTPRLILTVVAFAFFAGINFISSTHLMRQYISASLLFYAFALYIGRHPRWSFFMGLCACAVHNGTAPLAVTVVFACWIFRFREGVRFTLLGFLMRLILVMGMIAVMMTAVPFLQGDFLKHDVPNIKAGHFIVVGALFIIAHFAIQKQHLHLKSLYYARISFLAVYALSLGFFILGVPLYALRYFAYLEWLYGLLVGAIMINFFRDRPEFQVFVRFTVSLAAVLILVTRISISEFMYGPGDNYFLGWNLFEVLQLDSR